VIASTLEALRSLATTGRATIVAVLVAAFAFVTLSGCGARAEPPLSREPIRIGTYTWPGSFWIDVAFDKGWFAEAGLNVQRVDVNLKYFASMDDVAAGRLDAMGFSQYDLVRHAAAGHDLTGIIAIDYSQGAEALIAQPGIRQLQDLRGKKLALHRGTYLEYLLSVFGERNHVNVDEITLVDRSGDDAIADFRAGRVDAVLVWEPYGSEARAAGGVQIFSTADFPGMIYSVFTLRSDFIKAHPREITALVGVWRRADRFVHEHPQETCEIVSRLFDEPLAYSQGLLKKNRVLDLADNGRAFSYAAGFESLHGSWRRMNDFMLDRGLALRRVDSPAHLDSRFIRALQ
jgi:NitT/TauT family transport system substrate-binding protein